MRWRRLTGVMSAMLLAAVVAVWGCGNRADEAGKPGSAPKSADSEPAAPSAKPVAAKAPTAATANPLNGREITNASQGLVRRFETPSPCSRVSISPDGKCAAAFRVAGGERTLQFYDVERGKEAGSMKFPQDCTGMKFSPDGKLLACINAGSVRVVDAEAGRIIFSRDVPGAGICTAFTPDGRYLLAGYQIMVWETATRRERQALKAEEPYFLAVLSDTFGVFPDGAQGVSAGGSGLMIWSVPLGSLMREVKLEKGLNASSLVPLRDGRRVLAIGSRGLDLLSLETGREVSGIRKTTSDRTRLISLAPDGRQVTILSSGSGRYQAQVWDLGAGRMVSSTDIAKDGVDAACAARRVAWLDASGVNVWQVPNPPALPELAPEPAATVPVKMPATSLETKAPAPHPEGPLRLVVVSPNLGLTPADIRDALGLDESYTLVVADGSPLSDKADLCLHIGAKSVTVTDGNPRVFTDIHAIPIDSKTNKPLQLVWREAQGELTWTATARKDGAAGEPKSGKVMAYENTLGFKDKEKEFIRYSVFTWTPQELRRIAIVDALITIRDFVRKAGFPLGIEAKDFEERSIALLEARVRSDVRAYGFVRGETETKLVQAMSRAGNTRETISGATPVPAAPKTPEDAAAQKLQLARNFLANGMNDKAKDLLEQVVKEFPLTKSAQEAAQELKRPPAPAPAP